MNGKSQTAFQSDKQTEPRIDMMFFSFQMHSYKSLWTIARLSI